VIALTTVRRRWLPVALFAGALAAAWWRVPNPAPSRFAPPAAAAAPLPAMFTSALLPAGTHPGESSLTQLADGRIAAAWSADDTQEPPERRLLFSIREASGWRPPLVIASRASTAGGTFAHERDIGNPLLYAEGGWLHLWYTGRSGWAGRSLKHSVSTDGGKRWATTVAIRSAPLASGVRLGAPPITLADGGLGLPIASDGWASYGEYLRLAPTGEILDKQRLAQPQAALLPAVVALDEQRGLALLPAAGQILTAVTTDGGLTWPAAAALPVANPKTPLALLRLPSGRLLLAGNRPEGRATLGLWLSSDAGKTWQSSHTLENAADGAAEFSDPSLLLGRDGRLHLTYSWRRQGIKYLSFSEAWLDGTPP